MSLLSKFSTNGLIFLNFALPLTMLMALIPYLFMDNYSKIPARVGYVIGF
jgi:hypothetical protein